MTYHHSSLSSIAPVSRDLTGPELALYKANKQRYCVMAALSLSKQVAMPSGLFLKDGLLFSSVSGRDENKQDHNRRTLRADRVYEGTPPQQPNAPT